MADVTYRPPGRTGRLHEVARRRPLLLAAALVACAALAATARADGDPASDVLIVQKVFFPYGGGPVPKEDAAALESVVKQANAKGFTIRVAVIADKLDLGSVTALWRKPRTYAKFLGGELLFVYKKGRLLIVMPNGFGIFRGTKQDERILARIKTGSSADELVKAATTGVERIAAASGVKVQPVPKKASSSSDNRLAIALGGVAFLALLGLLSFLYLGRRRRGPAATPRS